MLTSYVRNNPLRYADPTGRCVEDGEEHGTLWCIAHFLGMAETAKQRRELRAEADAREAEYQVWRAQWAASHGGLDFEAALGMVALQYGGIYATNLGGYGGKGGTLAAPRGEVLTRQSRLLAVFQRLGSTPRATNAEGAMAQMNATLEAVEDTYSGVPRSPNPSAKVSDGRMYPALEDNIRRSADGTITATSRGHVFTYGPNGSITVTEKGTGNVVFRKN